MVGEKKYPILKIVAYILEIKKIQQKCKIKMRQKDNYVMVKRASPKQVMLPDGRTFVVRYERVSRDRLPPNVTI